MEFRERYKAVFSQVRPAKDFDPEEFPMKKSTRNIPKKLVLAAATVALLAGLCLTAYAANLFGLRDLLLPEKQEITPPLGPEHEEQQPYMADMISLAGYADTPESRATAEWQAFLSTYDPDGAILDSVGNDIFGWGTSYVYYQVYTREMADKLDEIAAKYGLKLHTDMLDDLYTNEALCEQVGGDFLGENQAGSTYMYEDGTFKFDGELELEGYGHLDYQFQRCVRGSFTDILLTLGDVDDYTEWTYTTASGVPATLALAPHRGLVIVDLPDSFVTVNVLAGSQTPEDDIFSSGPLTAEDLERLADSFDFTVLTPARPVDPDLPRPTLAEVQGWYTSEDFAYWTGLEESVAQRFYAELLALIENDDRQAVAEKILYPAYITVETGEFPVEDAEGFLPYYDEIFTEGLWESIMNTRYDMERADLIPDNGMVGAAGGAIWFALTQDGRLGILTIQNEEGRSIRQGSPGITAETSYDSARAAYAAVLEELLYAHILPDGTACEPYEPVDLNEFALWDVNGDGAEELVLLFTNTYSAGMAGYVVAYDEEMKALRTELVEFPMLTFCDNGYVKAGASHNQGRAGDSLWPYTLYRYDEAAKRYEQVAMVDAWDRAFGETYLEEPFPEEIDRSKTGVVYYIMTEGVYDISAPVDAADYEAWLNSQLGDASELEIPYLSLTEENIRQAREGR